MCIAVRFVWAVCDAQRAQVMSLLHLPQRPLLNVGAEDPLCAELDGVCAVVPCCGCLRSAACAGAGGWQDEDQDDAHG